MGPVGLGHVVRDGCVVPLLTAALMGANTLVFMENFYSRSGHSSVNNLTPYLVRSTIKMIVDRHMIVDVDPSLFNLYLNVGLAR